MRHGGWTCPLVLFRCGAASSNVPVPAIARPGHGIGYRMDRKTHMNRTGLSLGTSLLALAAAFGAAGCAAVISKDGIEQRAAQATGAPVGTFTISDQTEGDAGRIDFTVTTKAGAVYRCYLYSATGFQRAMSFGQTPHSDAICTAMKGGAAPAKPSCDALSKAAGKC